jgi:hypothetical protein
MDPEDSATDTGMLGSETQYPGPGRDTRRTDPDPAAAPGADDLEITTAMSDADSERTYLGTHETTGQPGR